MTICDFDEQAIPERPERPPLDLPDGVPPLRAFYLYMSNSCNLACRHCWITPRYVDGKPDPGDVIDVDALRAAVQEAKPMGLGSAKLTGGEPMLHPQFIEIVDLLSEAGLGLNMETNGTLLTAEVARYLKDETRLSFISVSIDGADAETHDAFRGVHGAFDAVLRGLDFLVAAGYTNAQVIMCAHRGNRDQIEDVVRLAAAHGAGSVKINPVTNSGRGTAMHERGEGLDFHERMALAHYVYDELRPRLREEGLPISLVLNTSLALMPIREMMRRGGRTGDCGVLGILGMLGNGDIVLCGIGRTIPELVYGRLGEDSIRDIWLTHPTILELRRVLADEASYPGVCGE
ncbi:MAG: radical SAM protein, partial [Chloroflexi bacterium]|nr:radical SAM protein [Chloroflexota bacterium]MBU1750146.1 radical SAM protein [Chloroflexota bacterium]